MRRLLKIASAVTVLLVFSEGFLQIEERTIGFLRKYEPTSYLETELGFYPSHPLWDHTLVSNYRGLRLSPGGTKYLFASNSDGFRSDRKLSRFKPQNAVRIFVLGDSFTEGWASDKTVSEKIEKRLSQIHPGKNFEVWNAGVAGQSVLMYTTRLRHQILDLMPDAVVVNIDQTDVSEDLRRISRTDFDSKGIPYKLAGAHAKRDAFIQWSRGALPSMLREASDNFGFCRLLWVCPSQLKLSELRKQTAEKNRGSFQLPDKYAADYRWTFNIQLTKEEELLLLTWGRLVEKMILLCRDNGIPLLITSYPHPQQTYGGAGRHMDELLNVICEQMNVPYFDAFKIIAANRDRQLYWDGDMHFNEEGQEIWSSGVALFVSNHLSRLWH